MILGGVGVKIEPRVLDVNTMKLSMLDVTWDDETESDSFRWNQSVEWNGKVYVLGRKHIHVITKDFKMHECIKN